MHPSSQDVIMLIEEHSIEVIEWNNFPEEILSSKLPLSQHTQTGLIRSRLNGVNYLNIERFFLL